MQIGQRPAPELKATWALLLHPFPMQTARRESVTIRAILLRHFFGAMMVPQIPFCCTMQTWQRPAPKVDAPSALLLYPYPMQMTKGEGVAGQGDPPDAQFGIHNGGAGLHCAANGMCNKQVVVNVTLLFAMRLVYGLVVFALNLLCSILPVVCEGERRQDLTRPLLFASQPQIKV